jgi:hypothetical protein
MNSTNQMCFYTTAKSKYHVCLRFLGPRLDSRPGLCYPGSFRSFTFVSPDKGYFKIGQGHFCTLCTSSFAIFPSKAVTQAAAKSSVSKPRNTNGSAKACTCVMHFVIRQCFTFRPLKPRKEARYRLVTTFRAREPNQEKNVCVSH